MSTLGAEAVIDSMRHHEVEHMALSPAEANATKNLLLHVPPSAVMKLQVAAAKYGMWGGCFSHACLASEALQVGYVPSGCDDPQWQSDMVSQDSTVQLVVDRLINDWEALPKPMRKTGNPETVIQLQKICRCFEILQMNFKAMVPEEIFDREMPALRAGFELGAMDEYLKKIVMDQPVPFDLDAVPDTKNILQRLQKDIDLMAIQKRKALWEHVCIHVV